MATDLLDGTRHECRTIGSSTFGARSGAHAEDRSRLRDRSNPLTPARLMLLSVNPQYPEPRKIRRAVDALEAGEVIGYPTDTVYGLGCDLFNKKAIDRLYQIKQMDQAQKLAFICPDISNVARYAIVEDATFRVLKRYLPGPYTFILEATREVPKMVQTKRRTVGVRIPHHPVILALVQAFGRPLISTTAAPHGEEPYIDPHEIDERFKGLGDGARRRRGRKRADDGDRSDGLTRESSAKARAPAQDVSQIRRRRATESQNGGGSSAGSCGHPPSRRGAADPVTSAGGFGDRRDLTPAPVVDSSPSRP